MRLIVFDELLTLPTSESSIPYFPLKLSAMKKAFCFASVLLGLSLSQELKAQRTSSSGYRQNALGIRISSRDAAVNNSISYKYFFTQTTAAEALFSFSDPIALGLLVEKYKPFGSSGFSWFYGAGAYTSFSGNRRFGLQGVVGLDVVAPSLPLNLSVDWKPELNFGGQFSFEPSAVGFSVRFVF